MGNFLEYAEQVRSQHKPRSKPRRPPSPWGIKSDAMVAEDELEQMPSWAPAYLEAFDRYLRTGQLSDRLAMHRIFALANPRYVRGELDEAPVSCQNGGRGADHDQPSLRLASR